MFRAMNLVQMIDRFSESLIIAENENAANPAQGFAEWERACAAYGNDEFARLYEIFHSGEPTLFPWDATAGLHSFCDFKHMVCKELRQRSLKGWRQWDSKKKRSECINLDVKITSDDDLRGRFSRFASIYDVSAHMPTSSVPCESGGNKIRQVFSKERRSMTDLNTEKSVVVGLTIPKEGEERWKYVERAAEKSTSKPVFANKSRAVSSHKVIARVNRSGESTTSVPFALD